jgi:hypothetical protein
LTVKRANRSKETSILSLLALSMLTLAFLAGPSFGAGTGASVVHPNLLSKMTLGLNAGPGAAQDFSISKGVQYYRLGITFNNATIQQLNTQARTTGVDYLGVLSGATLGVARSGPAYHLHCIANCNWTLSDWNATVSRALADYPTVHEWELWNEAYAPGQTSGYFTSALRYFTMVKSAYAIIKAYDKNDTVVCLGGSAVADTNAMTFTKAFWSYGASNYCDAVSLHAYISGTALFNTSKYENEEWPKNLQQYENVTQKPIWITEFGRQSAQANSTQHYSQDNQKYFIVQAMGIFASLPFVKRAYVYSLAGLSNPPDNTDFGLLNATTLHPKVAWTSFLSLYGKSASHTKVPLVSEKAPTLHITHVSIAKLLPDKISASATSKVDPVEILVNGKVKATGTGSVTYSFAGSILAKYNVTAYDKFTGLQITKYITVI